jgi:hypothetical protein
MWKQLAGLADPKVVVGLVLFSVSVLILAAATGGPAGQVLAGLLAVVVVLVALLLIFFYQIKRMNEDIGTNRRDIDPDFEDALEEYDED